VGRAFSAGGDLDMIEAKARAGAADPGGPARAANQRFMREFYGLFLSVRDLPCPSVAAIHGAAIGAGLCVALACDLRVAARDAKLGLNFVRLGIHPGMGAPRLPASSARAGRALFTGRTLDGAGPSASASWRRGADGYVTPPWSSPARSRCGPRAVRCRLAGRIRAASSPSSSVGRGAALDYETGPLRGPARRAAAHCA
jgi:hypothetical protein